MITRRFDRSGAHFAFTDRWGGVSAAPYDQLNLGGAVGDDPGAVRANRDRAAGALGLDPSAVVWMRQVHGRDVAVVDGPWKDAAAAASAKVDALVTSRRGLALAVLVADCTPVLLADPVAGVAAAAHAGRPGLVAGVVPAAVTAMCDRGARPERIEAVLGPSVCGSCYEVPEDMRSAVAGTVPEAWSTTSWGTPAVDVAAGVLAQLARIGVAMVEKSPVCTLESVDHFSYRRDRITGRLAGYVWLAADGAAGAEVNAGAGVDTGTGDVGTGAGAGGVVNPGVPTGSGVNPAVDGGPGPGTGGAGTGAVGRRGVNTEAAPDGSGGSGGSGVSGDPGVSRAPGVPGGPGVRRGTAGAGGTDRTGGAGGVSGS